MVKVYRARPSDNFDEVVTNTLEIVEKEKILRQQDLAKELGFASQSVISMVRKYYQECVRERETGEAVTAKIVRLTPDLSNTDKVDRLKLFADLFEMDYDLVLMLYIKQEMPLVWDMFSRRLLPYLSEECPLHPDFKDSDTEDSDEDARDRNLTTLDA